jgi:hypothetical protein
MKTSNLTEMEIKFMHYKLGILGSGMTALIDAIFKLDRSNRTKIALGFPELVTICNRFNDENGYWEDLEKRFKEQFNSKTSL